MSPGYLREKEPGDSGQPCSASSRSAADLLQDIGHILWLRECRTVQEQQNDDGNNHKVENTWCQMRFAVHNLSPFMAEYFE
jgi:hypothetical protein